MSEPEDVGAILGRLQSECLPAVLEAIERVVASEPVAGPSSLAEMTRYHFSTGGKRLRAVLPCLVSEILGAEARTAVPLGAACEMLHNATLVHDDLQDGDTHRRNQETIWKKFGAAQAINLGDAMFHYTTRLVAQLDVPPATREKLLQAIATDALQVLHGQELELSLRADRRPTMQAYLRMARGKTSALMALALGGGAVIAGAPDELQARLREIAGHLGLLFQIQDDVLDLYGDKGRQAAGMDVAEGKRSCLVVHALSVLGEPEQERLLSILDRAKVDTSADDIAEARALLDRAGSLAAALEAIEHEHRAALEVARRTGHRGVVQLTEHLAELFLGPIANVRAAAATHSGNALGREEDDEAFLLRMLPLVSRTFALSIEALPQSLRGSVRTAYLLCRVVDTVEDDARILPERRRALFQEFRAILNGETTPERFARASEWASDETPDAELCRGAVKVFSAFARLDPYARSRIRPPILEMSLGMDEYTQRAAEEGGLRIRDLEDLERYCYYVAGTVGQLLTELFLGELKAPSPELRRSLEARSVPFGLGLQLINVIRDVAADHERGVCYLPEDLMAQAGVERSSLLDPDLRRARLGLVEAVAERARVHLLEAIDYTLAWPSKEAEDIRFFCSVPLALALATLRRVGDEGSPGQTPKMGRTEVLSIFARAQEVAGSDRDLRSFLEDLVVAPRARSAATVGGPRW